MNCRRIAAALFAGMLSPAPQLHALAQSAQLSAEELRDRLLHSRAVQAVIWGCPL